jgi:uncharacterized protein (DUF427 family)
VYYIPFGDIKEEHLEASPGQSYCEWKGTAKYYSVIVGDKRADRAAWYYPDPEPDFETIRGCVAFYAKAMDACYVDDERARPQPGYFYGGWITDAVVGPFKGEPGTGGW